MMKWLITGSAGFIGSNLAEHLVINGDHVVGVDNYSTGKSENVRRIKEIDGERYRFIEGDVSDKNLVKNILEEDVVDIVVHLAAQSSVQKSFNDIEGNIQDNVYGFYQVLSASAGSGVKRFVYASSSAVYGNVEELPVSEAHCPDPLSPYASSKLMNELYGSNLGSLYSSIEIIGLRFFNIYGPWQDPDGDYAAVIPKWIQCFMSDSRPVIYGNGDATRDFCYVEDVCGLIKALGCSDRGDLSGIYNVCSGLEVSLNELFRVISNVMDENGIDYAFSDAEYLPWNTGDIVHSLGDPKLIRDKIGFDSVISIGNGLRKTLETQYI